MRRTWAQLCPVLVCRITSCGARVNGIYMDRPLTNMQRYIWYLIYVLQQMHGRSPGYDILGKELGITGQAAMEHIERLQQKGYVHQLARRKCAIYIHKVPPKPIACSLCPFYLRNPGICRHPVWSTTIQKWARVISNKDLPAWCPMQASAHPSIKGGKVTKMIW